MRSRVARQVVGVTLIAYAAGFVFFVIHAIFTFPAREVMLAFQWRWILNTAAAGLAEHLIPLQVTALVVLFSLLVGRNEQRDAGAGPYGVIRSVLPVLMVQTALVVVVIAVVLPFWHDTADAAVRQTVTARELRRRAEEAERHGEYSEAVAAYRLYLRINPSDEQAEQALAEAQTRSAAHTPDDEVTEPAPRRRHTQFRDLTAAELLSRSQAAYDGQEYFSAHYYAQLALESGQVPRVQAERLASQAWDRIRRLDPDQQELRERDLFRHKRAAYEELVAGRPIEAYYAFAVLAEEYPDDRDVQRYLREAEELAGESAFFIDELKRVAGHPGYREVVFRNAVDADGDERVHELVYIEYLIPTRGGVYATGLEMLRYRAGTRVEYHIAAEYAKLAGTNVIMRALDRNDPQRVIEPEVLRGEFPGAFSQVFPIAPQTETLVEFARIRSDMANGSLAGLLRLLRSDHDFGYERAELRFELMMRLLVPFSFIVLSVAALAFGVRLSARYLRVPPMLTAIGIVVLPLAAAAGYSLYSYVWQVVAGIIALQLPLVPGIVLLAATQTVMLFGVLVWAALGPVSES